MSQKLQLTIAEPCHENWDAMTPAEKGKFCGSCQKQVVDFTNMSDRQVAEFFKKPSTGSVCGRFMTDQLDRQIDIPRKRVPWIKYFFSIALPAFFISKAAAQQKKLMGLVARPPLRDTAKVVLVPQTITLGEVAPECFQPGSKKINLFDKPTVLPAFVKGKVVDEDGGPVPFASIEGGKIGEGVMADENGVFSINKNWLAKGKTIFVSSAGFEGKTINGAEGMYVGGELLVQLKANNILPEVVLSGMGTITCTRYMVGAVTMVKGQTTSIITEDKTTKTTTETLPQMDDNKLLVYPNPVTSGSSITLSFKKPEEGYYHVQLISLAGQLMQQKEIWIDAEARLLNVDIPAVAASTYFLVLTNRKTGKKFSEKIVVQ